MAYRAYRGENIPLGSKKLPKNGLFRVEDFDLLKRRPPVPFVPLGAADSSTAATNHPSGIC